MAKISVNKKKTQVHIYSMSVTYRNTKIVILQASTFGSGFRAITGPYPRTKVQKNFKTAG
jgi:hypothetical protein